MHSCTDRDPKNPCVTTTTCEFRESAWGPTILRNGLIQGERATTAADRVGMVGRRDVGVVGEEGRGRGGDVVGVKERVVVVETVFAVGRTARGGAEGWGVVVGERLAVGDSLAIWWSRRMDGSCGVSVIFGAISVFGTLCHSVGGGRVGVGGGGGK